MHDYRAIDDPNRTSTLPPLENGERLSADAFHARYVRYDPADKWELVEGTVYMASALYVPHGWFDGELAFLLRFYALKTPGVASLVSTSTRLSDESEVQPDHQLRILPSYGGQTRDEVDETGEARRIIGGPELVIEIAASSRSLDLGPKKRAYADGGVREYLVVSLRDRTFHAFNLRTGEPMPPDADGVWRSGVFPGLWLNPVALLASDTAGSASTLETGLASPEHSAFAKALRDASGS